MGYVELSYRLFGGVVRHVKPNFLDIKDELRQANISYTLEEYLSIALFTTAITFFLEAAMLSFIFGLLVSPALAVILALTLSLTISGILFFLFYSYPTTASKSRGNKIKKVLPFSVSYMATIARSNVPPITIFKTLSEFKEYGELSKEAENIVRDVELFGMTTSAAIKKQAKITPSKEFRDLLFGVNTMVTSGGNLGSYLKDKANELMGDYRRRIRKYSQDLSLYVEMYLTLIITGSIFFIVLSSIISTISAGLGTIMVQTFVVFALLPLLSIGFIILIRATSPTG
ncbi:MAG: type II secretion system F family protein [Candidatus Aenigmarchaeota archaeon]|nr:type II secretion system F family protein [Candidatus Aenigmarchaeota archaeon]